MGTYQVCAQCRGWLNTDYTPHEVIYLHDGKEVHVHYYACAPRFKEEQNGHVKSWVRGDIHHA